MEKLLRTKQLAYSVLAECFILFMMQRVFTAYPFSEMVFLSLQNISVMPATLTFVFVQLLIFLLCAWNTEWYKENALFVEVRLGMRAFRSHLMLNALISSLVMHLVLLVFCNIDYLYTSMVQAVFLAVLLRMPKLSDRSSYPILFIFYLIGCILWNSYLC